MAIEKRIIEDREFWFTTEHVSREDPDTGELTPTGQYYCAFSTREPGPMTQGEVIKDERGRARLFSTAEDALEAGIQEVKSRLRLPHKAYAVGLPYGNTDKEFVAYTKLLEEEGIITKGKSRVQDSHGRKWLHVWDDRREAERFATRLRRVTDNKDWEVYDLSPQAPLAGGADARPGPIVILVGRQSVGATYSLHPSSLKSIREQFPQLHPRPAVFIGSDTKVDIEASAGLTYDQIAVLLTGLSRKQLDELGGYRVKDPITDLDLYKADPIAT